MYLKVLVALLIGLFLFQSSPVMANDREGDLFMYVYNNYFPHSGYAGGPGDYYLSDLYLPDRQEIEYVLQGFNATAYNATVIARNLTPSDLNTQIEDAILNRYYDDCLIDSPREICQREGNTTVVVGDIDGLVFVLGKMNGLEGIFILESKPVKPEINTFYTKQEWFGRWTAFDRYNSSVSIGLQ